MVKGLNLDIFLLVGEYVESCPDFIMRWALVSKDAFKFFTSDKIWKRYNPYGLEEDIYKHFMKTCTKEDLKLLRSQWDDEKGYVIPNSENGYDEEKEKRYTGEEPMERNWYVWVAVLAGRLYGPHIQIPHKSLILAASEISMDFWEFEHYQQIEFELCEDLDFVKQICVVNRCTYGYHELWRHDKELALQVLEEPCPHRREHGLFIYADPDIQADREVIAAAKSNAKARQALGLTSVEFDQFVSPIDYFGSFGYAEGWY